MPAIMDASTASPPPQQPPPPPPPLQQLQLPFGGAFAQVTASTPVLLSVQGQGGAALPLQGCFAALATVAPSAEGAGVLSVSVQLQSLGPQPGCSAPLSSVTQWSALVSVAVDQAAPSLQV
jgi:hypothetical protein